VKSGGLSDAVREGLRVLKILSDASAEADQLWRRGLLAKALQTGVYQVSSLSRGLPPLRTASAVSPPAPSAPPKASLSDPLDSNLDSLLGAP